MIRPCLLSCLLAASCASEASSHCDGAKCDDPSGDDDFVTAAHRRLPLLSLGDGGVIASARVVTVVADGDPLANQLSAFGDSLLANDWYSDMAGEYGVEPVREHVPLTGAPFVDPGTPRDRAAATAYVAATIEAAIVPPRPDGSTIYVLFLPPGVPLQGNVDCSRVGAHHTKFGDLGDALAVVQRCGPESKRLQRAMLAASHEIAEAATDTDDGFRLERPEGEPWTMTPWLQYNGAANPWQNNVENADMCEGTRIGLGDLLYMRSFSNLAAETGGDPCAPALPIPYYSTSTDEDWYAGEPGATVAIPLLGWSEAPTEDWLIDAELSRSSGKAIAFRATVTGEDERDVDGETLATLNNAGVGELSVEIPADAPRGSWVTIEVLSFRRGEGTGPPPGEDASHEWLVGVFVPR